LVPAAQLETVSYACQRHEVLLPSRERAGFFLGDGVGLGKGRQLAGIIYDNWLRGRKRHLWVSVSADLMQDARRDLDDIGATDIPIHNITKLPYGAANRCRAASRARAAPWTPRRAEPLPKRAPPATAESAATVCGGQAGSTRRRST